MKEQLIDYWDNLSERDRLMLIIAGAVLFLFLLYRLFYAPLNHAALSAQEMLIEKQETLAWMKQVKPQAQSSQRKVEKLDTARLLSALSDRIKAAPFHRYTYQLQQSGPKEIHLSFDEIPYNEGLSWLSQVSAAYAFSIKQLDIERTTKIGIVKFSLTIEIN